MKLYEKTLHGKTSTENTIYEKVSKNVKTLFEMSMKITERMVMYKQTSVVILLCLTSKNKFLH